MIDYRQAVGGGTTDRVEVIDTAEGKRSRGLSYEQEWPTGFDAIVRAHTARLVKSLTLITLDRGLAEDAAQEAFLQLHLHWRDPEVKDPVAWLYRVGINRCKDYRRAMGRTARLGQRLAGNFEQFTPPAWNPDPDLISILRPLPKRQRTAAALSYLAGFSTSEIARTMDISEGAVGSHLHKAREALRKILEEK